MIAHTNRDTGDECDCLNCLGTKLWIFSGTPSLEQINMAHENGCVVVATTGDNFFPTVHVPDWPEGMTYRDLMNEIYDTQISIRFE